MNTHLQSFEIKTFGALKSFSNSEQIR